MAEVEDVKKIKDETDLTDIKHAIENQLQKRQSQIKLQSMEKGDTVTVSGTTTPDDSLNNFVVVSTTQSDRNKLNTSTITINSDLPDPSNSLASNISQVR